MRNGNGGATRSARPAARRLPVPILMYHQVTPSPRPEFRKYAVTTQAFEAQLAWLTERGYASISMQTFYEHRTAGRALPPKPVVLTFDDGYRDCLEHAAPVLAARGFTATFYLLGGAPGESSRWLLAEKGVEFPLLDWNGMRALLAAGHECGSHTLSHPRLTRVSSAECRNELVDSRRRLEDELGVSVSHFAYPFGVYDERVREIAIESGYRTACSVRPGWSPPDDDLHALRRVHVLGGASIKDFAWAFRRRYSAAALLRAGGRALRRRLVG